jgi:hypothetical protein
MEYSAAVPADNLYIKDIPAAIREKGKELAAISEGYPPIVNADKVDGFDASQTPGPNTIPVTGADGKLPATFVKIEDGITAGSGLVKSGQTLSMQTPLTCTLSTANAFPGGGGHTHKVEVTIPEAAAPAFAFYENFAGHKLTALTSSYILVKTFTIPIPAAGVYFFDCAYKVDAWSAFTEGDYVRITLDGTMVFGRNTGAFDEEIARAIIGWTEATEQSSSMPIYEPVGAIKTPALSGRAVYFNSGGTKLLKVYMKGANNFEISNFCVGVLGAATA